MPGIMFSNFYETGTDPRSSDVKAFGDFDYFDNGDCFKLAKPKGFVSYILSPGKLKKDLYDSRWKVGFLKGLFKLPMDYLKMFNRLVKMK